MALRARNKDTGQVWELQNGEWVTVHEPRTSIGNAISGGVEGSRAVGDYLGRLIFGGITKFKKAFQAGSKSFGEPSVPPDSGLGPLDPQIPFISGREAPPLPGIVKRAALPVIGGIVGGGVGAMGGEFINQLTGITDPSISEGVIAGITPPGSRGIFRAGKASFRGGTGFFVPQAMRESGVELAKARFSGAASRQLYRQLLDKGTVPTHKIGLAIDRMIVAEAATSKPRKEAIETLQLLRDKLTKRSVPRTEAVFPRQTLTDKSSGFTPRPTTRTVEDIIPVNEFGYKDLVEEVQRLRRDAQFHFSGGTTADPNTGVRLSKSANAIIEELDTVSDIYKQANAAFRREESIKALAKELRKGNPGISIRTMFEQDDLIRETFSSRELKEIIDIADDIGRFGTGATLGASNRFIMAVSEPFADLMTTDNGRIFLRVLIQQPGITAAKAAEAFGQILNQMRRGTIKFTED